MTIAPALVSAPALDLPRPLVDFFDRLDRQPGRLSLELLEDATQRLDLPQVAFSALTDFDTAGYTRTVLHQGPSYEALLMCWLPGQHSVIHDHRGSHCAFRVLMGTATETVYSLDQLGRAHACGERHYTTGHVAASSEGDIHRVSNLEGEDLVTLHVYSPSLRQMRTYRSV